MFKNMKFATKLTIAFSAVLVLLVAVAAVGLWKIASIKDHARYAGGVVIEALKATMEVRDTYETRDKLLRAMTMATDERRISELKAAYMKERERAAENVRKLDTLVSTPEGKAILARLNELQQRTAPISDRAMAMVSARDRGAEAYIINNFEPAIERIHNVVDTLVGYKEGLLKEALAQSESDYRTALVLLIGGSAAALVLAALLGFVVTRGVTVPMAQAVKVAEAVAAGDFSKSSVADRKDEVGQLLVAMGAMVTRLQQFQAAQAEMARQHDQGWIDEKIDASKFPGAYAEMARGVNDLVAAHIAVKMKVVDTIQAYVDSRFDVQMDRLPGKKAQITAAMDKVQAAMKAAADAAVETLRVKIALDSSSTNVMIADRDGTIIYMNSAVAEMLARNETEIRKALPNFSARNVQGASFDIFHKNPAHQRNMLAHLRGTHKTQIQVGGAVFALNAAPIFDQQGERVGTVVEWRDRTVEVAAEREIAEVVQGAVLGDFTNRLMVEGKEGFFKQLAENMNKLMETADVGLNEVSRVLAALARGELTERIDREYHGLFGQLKNDANKTVETLAKTIADVRAAADALTSASEQVSSTAQSLSQGASEQAASVEETSASVQQMQASIRQNSENAKVTDGMASKASKEATEGGEAVTRTVEAMKSIATKISIIDDIAYQTNLLALNAAIEAARAGEHGKGFAVVAAEVRKLAERSQVAAQEIGELAGSSVNMAEKAGSLLTQMVPSINKTSDLVQEIAAASEEQNEGVNQINAAMGQLNTATQQNASASEELAATAEELSGQAEQLQELMAFFKLQAGADTAVVRSKGGVRKPAAKPARGNGAAPALNGGGYHGNGHDVDESSFARFQ